MTRDELKKEAAYLYDERIAIMSEDPDNTKQEMSKEARKGALAKLRLFVKGGEASAILGEVRGA